MRVLVVGLALASSILAVSACGGDDDGDSSPDAGSVDGGTADATGGLDATPLCVADFASCDAFEDHTGDAIPVDVEIGPGSAYTPRCVRITAGQQVSIEASATHPLFADGCSPSDFIGGTVMTSEVYTLTEPGLYAFGCRQHGETLEMRGMIQVVAE